MYYLNSPHIEPNEMKRSYATGTRKRVGQYEKKNVWYVFSRTRKGGRTLHITEELLDYSQRLQPHITALANIRIYINLLTAHPGCMAYIYKCLTTLQLTGQDDFV